MKTLKIFSLFIFLSSLFIQGRTPHDTITDDLNYQAGEKLKYLMYYGFVNGGEAYLQLKRTKIHGKEVLHAKAIGKTIGLADRLFNVYDVYESYFDPRTGLPVKSIGNVKEGGYKFYNEVTFNHRNNTINSKKSGRKSVPDNLHDLVSAFYYLRKTEFENLKVGDIIQLNTYFQDEYFNLRVRYRGTEEVETKLGEIDCLKFIPVVGTGEMFENDDDLKIWISKDKNFVPVRVSMDMLIGSFKADLVGHSGLKYKLNFRD